ATRQNEWRRVWDLNPRTFPSGAFKAPALGHYANPPRAGHGRPRTSIFPIVGPGSNLAASGSRVAVLERAREASDLRRCRRRVPHRPAVAMSLFLQLLLPLASLQLQFLAGRT